MENSNVNEIFCYNYRQYLVKLSKLSTSNKFEKNRWRHGRHVRRLGLEYLQILNKKKEYSEYVLESIIGGKQNLCTKH